MGIILLLIGIGLFFMSLNLLGIIIAIISMVLCEIFRRKEKNKNNKIYVFASIFIALYLARYITVVIIP